MTGSFSEAAAEGGTAGGMRDGKMNGEIETQLHVGDRVALIEDDWFDLGHDIVLVDIEPVPGSTQCLVTSDGETRTVSRLSLRRL